MNHQSDYGYSTDAVSMRCLQCGTDDLDCGCGTPKAKYKAIWCNSCQINPANGCRHPVGHDCCPYRGSGG